MAKRLLSLALASVMVVTLFTGCAGNAGGANAKMKLGMVTDAGTIDDKSFNQGAWEGVQKAGTELKLDLKKDTKYLKPTGTTEADYLKEIANLNDAGFKFIVCPGFKFETAIFKAQDKYPDSKFVLIDGQPHSAEPNAQPVVKNNTVAIFYAEHEAGYLAGVATALQIKDGEVGFIGGMEIPPVQKYNWGFQQGIKYANEKLGTKIIIKPENVVYQGSFDNVAAGQQLAAQMFDKGVKAIFCAAGGVGVGAINEAKARMKAGKQAWIIGVDVDQYADGQYEGEKSVILTSAMKKIQDSVVEVIKNERDGKFPGGQTLVLDAKTNGIGIPEKNPNLSADTKTKVDEAFKKIVSGEIKVSAEKGSLIK